MTTDLSLFDRKLQLIIATSVEGLDPADRAERIAWCREHDQHGTHAFVDGDDLTLWWGGRRLAVAPRSLFDDDVPLEELRTAFLPEPPDDLSELT